METRQDEQTETKLKRVDPVAPAELWLLWDIERGEWVESLDQDGSLLAYQNGPDANTGANHQFDRYDVRSRPMRVK